MLHMFMLEARCIKCFVIFCCAECRWKHEQNAHGLKFDCPICRGYPYHCDIRKLTNDFKQHLVINHLPLKCKKCKTVFESMDTFENLDKCTSLSELIDSEAIERSQVDEKFDCLYDKINNDESESADIAKASRTAVVTPMVNRIKLLVDYPVTDSEDEKETPKNVNFGTPYPILAPKTPKLKKLRSATPHVKKFIKQKAVEFGEDACDEEEVESNTEITPSRNEEETERKNFTTPTSHLSHAVKLVQAVTTSTPTHSTAGAWSLFPEPGADSPLSEIENTNGSTNVSEASKSESDMAAPKLKSIMSGSRLKVGSQDSSEKQDSVNNTDSSAKAKKVTFAEDTIFQLEPKKARVFRKPKRMLTPGPQKPKYCFNPRFQALINRFENNGKTMARTPTTTSRKSPLEVENNSTPPVEKHSNILARAINFKEDSPVVESQDNSKETTELFRTCVDSPESSGFANAITALTTNVAGSLHNCLDSVLKTTNEETEIEFKFVITKRKVTVKRIAEDVPGIDMNPAGIERETNKENIWTTVAKVVKSVFWGEQGTNSAETPFRTYSSEDTTSSSASKRKFDDLSDAESPLNHKRKKIDGRIKARPSIHRHRSRGVTPLRSTLSAEQEELVREIASDEWNQSF